MLPKLPYKGTRREREIVAFLGLNRTEATKEGELRDAKNMAVGEYPTLTQRKARTALTGYDAPSDIYEWDGHLLVVDGGVLYYDGDALCNVMSGVKQYAVVNTKLVVWDGETVVLGGFIQEKLQRFSSLVSLVLTEVRLTSAV